MRFGPRSSGKKLTDADRFPFGRYRGKKVEEVPVTYLDWISRQDWIKDWPDVLAYIQENRNLIDWALQRISVKVCRRAFQGNEVNLSGKRRFQFDE